MEYKDLTIRYKIDASQAKSEDKEFHDQAKRNMAQNKDDHRQAAKEKQDAIVSMTAEQRRAMQADRDFATQAKKNAGEVVDAHKGITAELKNLTLGIGGLAIGNQVMGSLARGVDEVAEKVKQMTVDFLKQRDALRELAGVMNQKGDIKFTQEQLQFAARAGMTPEEAKNFRSAFRGEVQQYKGKFASEKEFGQYEEEVARYASRTGVEPGVAASLAGGIVRTQPKGMTSQSALTALGQSFGTLQAGSGENTVLAAQLASVVGTMVGPGRTFKTPQEAAVAIRAISEGGPRAQGESATLLEGLQTGITQLKPEEQSKLGITAKTPFFEMIEQVGKKQEEAVAGGLTSSEFLQQAGFSHAHARRALELLTGPGTKGKVIEAGFADIGKVGAGDVERETAGFFADPSQAGRLRQEEAKNRAINAGMVESQALIAPFREQAKGILAPQMMDERDAGIRDLMDKAFYYPKRILFGSSTTSAQQMELEKAGELIQGEAQQAGAKFEPLTDRDYAAPTRQLEQRMAEIVRLTQEANEQRRRQTPAVPPPMRGKPTAPVDLRPGTVERGW